MTKTVGEKNVQFFPPEVVWAACINPRCRTRLCKPWPIYH